MTTTGSWPDSWPPNLAAGETACFCSEPAACEPVSPLLVVAGVLGGGGVVVVIGAAGGSGAALLELGAAVVDAAARVVSTELETGTWSAGTRVTWMDCEAPRKRLGLTNRLLTRTVASAELELGATWSLVEDCCSLDAPLEAAEASELIAEALIPNWPVRVTTTKRGFVERVLETLAVGAEVGAVPSALVDSELGSLLDLCNCGRDKRDLFDGILFVRLGEVVTTWVSGAATVAVGDGAIGVLGAAEVPRAGCSVCNCERNLLDAILERANERASDELEALSADNDWTVFVWSALGEAAVVRNKSSSCCCCLWPEVCCLIA